MDAESIETFGDVFVAHCTEAHADLPFPEPAVRAYGQSMARMTGPAERLDDLGTVEIHPVTAERIDDWLHLFDHDLFVTTPENGSCYCLEPHEIGGTAPHVPWTDWQARRAAMAERLRAGTTYGYLAYVDGRPAGWVNASMRCDETLFRRGDDADDTTVGIACFAIAPPYRGHGLAPQLLERVVADAAARGAAAVQAYPFNEAAGSGFRGARSMYETHGFTQVALRQRDAVLQLKL
jgi:GNAT superfamily N-acetyltransferase